MDRIRKIISSNAFCTNPVDHGVYHAWTKVNLSGRIVNDVATDLPDDSASGFWINQSYFNHSCTPNVMWFHIGDQIFVRATRDIQAGEELSLSYVNNSVSFAKRESIFSEWIEPGVGFACQCDWCRTIRVSPDLRQAEEAIKPPLALLRSLYLEGVPMAIAAERSLPDRDRAEYFKLYSRFPLKIQHIAAADWIIEGSCLMAYKNKPKKALEAYENAAAIIEAVCGYLVFVRAKDLWRIVGACMACRNEARAKSLLAMIWNDFFVEANIDVPSRKFLEITVRYALPWWIDNSSDRMAEMALRRLAGEVAKHRRQRELEGSSGNENSRPPL